VRDHLTERYTPAPRSRTSALLQWGRRSVDGGSIVPVGFLWERTLCATILRSGTPLRHGRAQVRSYKGGRRSVDGGSILPVGFLWERTLCATNLRSGTPQRRGRAQVRSYKGGRRSVDGGSILPVGSSVGAHPVRDNPTERYTPAWLSPTGCAPTDKRQARHQLPCAAKAEAQRGPALSPQRFGRVAQRLEVSLCTLGGCPTTAHLKRSGLSQHDAAGVIRPFSLGYFRREASPVGSFGPAREK
jgi:hypothetical protein